jgi:hypothetical protein
MVGPAPEVVSKALWKEPSAYRCAVPIQGSSTTPNRGFASMSTSLRLPQTCGPLAERNSAPNQRTFAASGRPFVASQIGPFRGLRQEFPICGKGQVGIAGRPESLGPAPAFTRGCRIKPSRKTCCATPEMATRAAGCDDLGTDAPRMTDAVADFGTHPQKRSSGLAGGLCDSLTRKR